MSHFWSNSSKNYAFSRYLSTNKLLFSSIVLLFFLLDVQHALPMNWWRVCLKKLFSLYIYFCLLFFSIIMRLFRHSPEKVANIHFIPSGSASSRMGICFCFFQFDSSSFFFLFLFFFWCLSEGGFMTRERDRKTGKTDR